MIIEKEKIKLINFCFFLLFFSLLILFINAGIDLVGLYSLIFISLVTLYFSKKYGSLATILYFALFLRLFLIYLGNYFIILPDSWGDAVLFENYAWELAQYDFFVMLSKFSINQSSYFISWVLAFFYFFLDRSIILGQSLSLLFGMGSIILGVRLANKIWNEETSIKIGWIFALYPTLILYSILTLRESYVWFFLLVAIYGIVCWSKNNSLKALIITFLGFLGATLFHGGMVIGVFIFIFVLMMITFIKTASGLKYLKIYINSLLILSFSIISIFYLFLNSDSIPKIGFLTKDFDSQILIDKIESRNINDAAYPEWTIPKTDFEIIYKAPIRVIYFIFSPFMWDIKKNSHFIGYFDGIFYLILFFLFIKNFKSIWSDRTLRIIIIILASYLLIFGVGTGNFGTGIRHRTKFLIIFILMVAPWIPKFVIKKDKWNIFK